MYVEVWQLLLVFIVGIITGIINILSAGGSLLTLPILIFLGLPAADANGTNRIAILVQSTVGITAFQRQGWIEWKARAWTWFAPAAVGSLIGAWLAVDINGTLFQRLLSIMMVFVLILLFIPKQKLRSERLRQFSSRKIVQYGILPPAFFCIGIYGGLIQAGVGFFIVGILMLFSSLPLQRINAYKVAIVGVFIFLSLFIFLWYGKVYWGIGLSLAAGSAIGAWIGAKIAVEKGERWIQTFMAVAVIVMAVQLWFF